jgi:hypothetical protein
MKTTAKTDIVNYLLGLFATLVLLVSRPRGKKGGPQKWTKITAQDMADPAYLQKRVEGNIGVIMGLAPGGISSFVWMMTSSPRNFWCSIPKPGRFLD